MIRMRIGMRQFSEAAVEWLRDEAAAGVCRHDLAVGLCEREGWVNAAGEPCVASARLALPDIARRFGFSLPTGTAPPPPSGQAVAAYPDVCLEGGLSDLGSVGLEPVSGAAERRSLRSMMAAHHPRGRAANPGAALHYWIVIGQFGRIGGLCFHAASWHQKARDEFIGWDDRQRRANLGLVVNNSRFLLLPGVRVANLASHVLGLAVRRLADDWQAAHGVRPALAVTFVGAEHAGTCYAAAGWERVGETSGVPPGRRTAGAVCGVWLRPLESGWRRRLCHVAGTEPLWLGAEAPALTKNAHWTELEFGFSSVSDGRLRRRIVAMAREWEKRPGEPVSVVFPASKDQKAAYRLLSNPKVTMDDLLESHRAATVRRCRDEETVLAVQDTTMLDFSGLKGSTGGLATLDAGDSGSRGIPAHVTLAVSAGGRSLGVLDIDAGIRAGDTVKSADEEAATESESARWMDSLRLAQRVGSTSPGTRVISVCDREDDIREMFKTQAREPAAAGLLARACASECLPVVCADGQVVDLRKLMEGQPVVGNRSVKVVDSGRKARKPRPARTAKVGIRTARIALKAPGDSEEMLPLLAVFAVETTAPPKDCQPVRWLLLSSDGEPDEAGAETVVDHYAAKGAIEEYFKVLKQAMRIEDRQLDEADDLLKGLAFDAILAWRVFDIQRAAKAKPDLPALGFLDRDELAALYIGMLDYGFSDVRSPPFGEEAFDGLTIQQAAIDVARFVGFIPAKRQPLPGAEKMRKGMRYMLQATATYRAFKNAGMIAE